MQAEVECKRWTRTRLRTFGRAKSDSSRGPCIRQPDQRRVGMAAKSVSICGRRQVPLIQGDKTRLQVPGS